MSKLEKRIHDEKNGLDYVLVGDYYIPALIFPEESRPIGKWGRMHRAYLKERHPGRYSALLLSGKLETYLADLDKQAQARFEAIVCQDQFKFLRKLDNLVENRSKLLRRQRPCP